GLSQLGNGGAYSFGPVEVDLRSKAGATLPALVGGTGVDQEQSIGFVLDLTKMRELEQRLQRSEKFRSLALMAAGIAHDFNNLLTAIIGHATLAEGDLQGMSRAKAEISHSLAAAHRAADLVAQLLAYTGRIWYTAEAVSISVVVDQTRAAIAQLAPWPLQVKYELVAELPPVRAGVAELQQVIRNLVQNSAEAMAG